MGLFFCVAQANWYGLDAQANWSNRFGGLCVKANWIGLEVKANWNDLEAKANWSCVVQSDSGQALIEVNWRMRANWCGVIHIELRSIDNSSQLEE